MNMTTEKRRENRLDYHWLMQYAKSVKQPLLQGRMVDLSSKGAAFICIANHSCPQKDQLVTTRFSVPRFDSSKTFDSTSYKRIGRVCRVDNINNNLHRIAIQFARPLPFKPGEQKISKYDRVYSLATKIEGLSAALSLRFDPDNIGQ
ncbi:MAG: PilZ domain-containing protein [Planctomycetota bacterium]|jgi:hypothetical protein